MSDKSTVGLSAFPTPFSGGMTLRDYFAAKAMTLMAMQAQQTGWWPNGADAKMVAEDAYAIADAMLAERDK